MAVIAPKTQPDGLVHFGGGQDSGRSPQLLRPDQAAELYNSTVRGGKWRPRPGYDLVELTFPTVEMETWFKTKKNQGVKEHISRNGKTLQVWSVGGRFFTVDVDNHGMVQEITPILSTTTSIAFTVPVVGASVAITVTDSDRIRAGYPVNIGGHIYNVISISGSTLTAENVDDTPTNVIAAATVVTFLDVNSQDIGIVYMIQAEDFLIAQDGLSKAFIFDGGSSRRSMTEVGEIPTGTVMAYGIGRIWLAIPGRGFVAGDIVYGPSGTPAYDKRDAILKFTENTFLAGGGAFAAPGDITAMAFISSLDTSTGQGPLMVFTDGAVLSVNAPTNREAWAVITNPIQTVSLIANGATSFYGTIPTVNGDIFYRSLDGMRSFFLARRERGTFGNTPISRELLNLLNTDSPELLKYHSAIMFENRLLFTGRSRPDRYGASWQGIGALDFDNMSSMLEKSPPVYDGTWTGVDPVWLFTCKYGRVQRAFIAAINSDGENELWEISKNHQFDNGSGRIKWTMVSRAFSFKSPLEMVRLENLEMFQDTVMGRAETTVRFRPDEYPCWSDWKEQSICYNWRKCTPFENCELPIPFQGGYKTRLPFGQPPDTDDTADGKPMRLGYVHQLEIVNEGYFEVRMLRLVAVVPDEEVYPPVDQPEPCKEINCCLPDYYAWRSSDATDAAGESGS